MDILVLISLLTQIVFAQNLDFCQSFADNDYNIDYGYVSELDGRYVEEIFLFIGNAYWLIDGRGLGFRVNHSTGRRINWFGSQYRIAITAKLCCFHNITPLTMTGLLYVINFNELLSENRLNYFQYLSLRRKTIQSIGRIF